MQRCIEESCEPFATYFLPSKKTTVKRFECTVNNCLYDDDYEYDYQLISEFNWNVKNNSSKGYKKNNFLRVDIQYNLKSKFYDIRYMIIYINI